MESETTQGCWWKAMIKKHWTPLLLFSWHSSGSRGQRFQLTCNKNSSSLSLGFGGCEGYPGAVGVFSAAWVSTGEVCADCGSVRPQHPAPPESGGISLLPTNLQSMNGNEGKKTEPVNKLTEISSSVHSLHPGRSSATLLHWPSLCGAFWIQHTEGVCSVLIKSLKWKASIWAPLFKSKVFKYSLSVWNLENWLCFTQSVWGSKICKHKVKTFTKDGKHSLCRVLLLHLMCCLLSQPQSTTESLFAGRHVLEK